jgi:hypothetical protein
MEEPRLIRVHGVATADEASELEALGVNLIGVVVGAPEDRVLSRETAYNIARRLTRARLCVEPAGVDLTAEDARRMGADVVVVPWGREVAQSWLDALAQADVAWGLVRIPVDEDDDPSWVESRIAEAGVPAPTWVEVEVCPNLKDGWSLLRETNESELDAADLDQLACAHPIIFSPAFRPDNVRSIRDTLAHARGFSFTLADYAGRVPGAHRYSPNELRALLDELRTNAVATP